MRRIVLCLLLAAVAAHAADLRDTARAALDTSADAVLSVRLVVKLKMQGQESEQKIEVNATVIDPAGLLVTSASQLDPTATVKALVARMGQQGAGFQIDSEIKETMVLLPSGTEAEADVTMTDNDLDLAFIRLRDKTQKLSSVGLVKREAVAKPLDDCFVIGRTGKAANRTPFAALGHV